MGLGPDVGGDCSSFNPLRAVFANFGGQFVKTAKHPAPQLKQDGRYLVTTMWGSDQWAASTYLDMKDAGTITAYSKWVNVQGKPYQVQAWRKSNVAGDTSSEHYAVSLYDASLRKVADVNRVSCGSINGDYADRVALRLVQSALKSVTGVLSEIYVYKEEWSFLGISGGKEQKVSEVM